jgi:hypothetical protein
MGAAPRGKEGVMSLADWQFQSTVTVALDESAYYSPPSSLKLLVPVTPAISKGFCLLPSCSSLHSGRLEFRSLKTTTNTAFPLVAFRVGTEQEADFLCPHYYLIYNDDDLSLAWSDIEGTIWLGEWEIDLPDDNWHHLRLSWWESGGHLIVQLEEESGGAWANVLPPFDTGQNRGAADPLARVAVGVRALYEVDQYVNFDDVKIYALASPA